MKENDIKCYIHLSGECAEINRLSIDFFNKLDISRYIFHRKNTIEDMESCISNNEVKNLEYEAFILNERCHYTGAFCNSLHCDEMIHLCKMPYQLSKVSENANNFKEVDRRLKLYYKELEQEEESYVETACACDNQHDVVNEDEEENIEDSYILGSTGCGICSLKRLKEAGITHLKVVGRGNSIKNMEKDVRNLKKAISMLDNLEDNASYEETVKEKLFSDKCSGECYYDCK